MQTVTIATAPPVIHPPGLGHAANDPPAWCPPDALGAYLEDLMAAFRSPLSAGPAAPGSDGPLAESVFDLLTSRPFSYLGRSKAAPYRSKVMPSIHRDVALGRSVRFYFDIGPGYHASVEPDRRGIDFEVGLAELLALRQVTLFRDAVRAVYPPGVHFWLVIDNLCGLYTNDVPLFHTEGYVHRLRTLIEALGVGETVELLVESEAFTETEYRRVWRAAPAAPPPTEVCDADLENVARFLGRPCSRGEAARRIEGYRRAGIVTETLLARVVDGVRLTQRASPATLGFRSFPGGAQRMQVGEIVLAVRPDATFHPLLLSSRNRRECELARVATPAALPGAVAGLGLVRRLDDR